MFNFRLNKTKIYWIPFLSFCIFFLLKIFSPSAYYNLIQEDSALENFQAGFYMLSSIISGAAALSFYRKEKKIQAAICATMSAAFAFVCLEEISWFQRILQIESPDFFLKYNFQDEITIHNLDPIQANLHFLYILVSGFCSFSFFIRKMVTTRLNRNIVDAIDLLIPRKFISSYFIPTFLIYFLYEFFNAPAISDFFVWRDQEPAELLMASGFLLLTIINFCKSRS